MDVNIGCMNQELYDTENMNYIAIQNWTLT
jgi:hypothetical protein